MTQTKKVRTFEQLDALLRKRGKSPEELGLSKNGTSDRGQLFARVHGKVYVRASPRSRTLNLIHEPGKFIWEGFMHIAEVHSVAGGDTLYKVTGYGKERSTGSRWRLTWRRLARRLTPYDGLKCKGEWRYRVKPDGRFEYLTWGGTGVPDPHYSRLYPSSVIPKGPAEWARAYEEACTYPNFIDRAKRFARWLRLSVGGQFGASVQLLWQGNRATTLPAQGPSMWLQVCLPPHENQAAKRLLIAIAMHDKASRQLFHVDGDYGQRHCQFLATDLDAYEMQRGGAYKYRWKCQADAIIGIKEWVLGSLYIPGPDF